MEIIFETSVNLHAIDQTRSRGKRAWRRTRVDGGARMGKFAQLLQTIGRQRMSEVEQQGRRAVLVYY